MKRFWTTSTAHSSLFSTCVRCIDFTSVSTVIRLNFDFFFRQCSNFCFFLFVFYFVLFRFNFVACTIFSIRIVSLKKGFFRIILSSFHTFILTTCCNSHIHFNFQDNYISILFTSFHNLKLNSMYRVLIIIFIQSVRFCMSNNSLKSVLVICPQGQYRYLPSNIYIGPRIQLPVSVQWCQTLYVKVQGKMV